MSALNRIARRLPRLSHLTENITGCAKCVSCPMQKYLSSKTQYPKDDHVVTMARNGDKIVLWHPEKKFPYELSKPMPRDKGNLEMGDNPSMLQYHPVLDEKRNHEGPSVIELSKMFHTTKHPWYPRSKDKKTALRDIPVERNAL